MLHPYAKPGIGTHDFGRNTIPDLLYQRATYAPHDIAYSFPERDQALSWGQLWRDTRTLAEGLIRLGIKKGDRVAVLFEGRGELITALFAAVAVGAVVVPINTYSTAEELKRYFLDAQPEAFLFGANFQGVTYLTLAAALHAEADADGTPPAWAPHHVFVHGTEAALPTFFRPFSDLLDPNNALADAAFVAACQVVGPHDPAFLLYTSGSTGAPKGVVRTTASFLVKHTARGTGMGARIKGALGRATDRYTRRFSMMSLLPLYHLGGIGTLFTSLKVCNVRTVMLTHYNPVVARRVAEEAKCQFLIGTPFMLQAMLAAQSQSPARLDSVLGMVFASAAVNSAMLERITKELKNLYFFTVSYGSSEAGAVANGTCLLNRKTNLLVSLFLRLMRSANLLNGVIGYDEFSKTPYSICGKIDKSVEVRMRDLQTGEFLPAGQPGEIVIRSHRVMRYAHENLVAESFTSDGWYKSGDIGYVSPGGYLILSDRIKRLISRGGEKISPVEVEDAMLKNEGISEVFVLGIPDELYGEQVCAAYVEKEGAGLSILALREELGTRLSRFKVPKHFVAFPALPLSASGKISSEEIKKRVLTQLSKARVDA